ncbi:MAG: protein kinase, partial [Deltaproteobacteria bacterium]|nr:protein kinase [Deltaproteobacteria bacterium]
MSMTRSPSASSGSVPAVSLQAVIEAPRRLDELSTARVIGEAAEAVHKAQKGGQPLGTLTPHAILVATSGISLGPPPTPSVAYTAPERLRGQPGDRRSDVFSLGVLLWEALAHERLFDAPTDDARKAAVLERAIQAPSELNANVPAELDAICRKALERDPANRYQSAKVMAAEISAVLDDAGYPDTHDQIASYVTTAFPTGAPAAPSTTGAALAAKLAATPTATPAPSTRPQQTMTMHGMAPIREPLAKPVEAKPVETKPVET